MSRAGLLAVDRQRRRVARRAGRRRTLTPWWVSWYSAGGFLLHTPWWCSGYAPQGATICAVVMARNENHAKERIRWAHDDPAVVIDWRFAGRRPTGWTPFGDRFPRATWMRWPD